MCPKIRIYTHPKIGTPTLPLLGVGVSAGSASMPVRRQAATSRTPDSLHAMPSADLHVALRCLAQHHISPAQRS
jgi:hypothetical protein